MVRCCPASGLVPCLTAATHVLQDASLDIDDSRPPETQTNSKIWLTQGA